ncbi:hypothetical protein BBF96_14005 [Anoxybacter fermentans]|uniref:DMT family transporter n=1 Tax=Anoxybacter fermentans TaxID=1323375 RepID=A0A3Q9HRZ0_9FIRM|nr:DMT family transporter [Anoxybacter fermentans]AZR74402.1 hypothetical protein BBF96_14005 [Anoxybacter fermentans]
MKFSLWALLTALIAGITMAVQGALNSSLSKKIGLLEATFVVHFLATLLLILILFVFRLGKGDFSKMSQVPWYIYLGGLLGVIITYTVVVSIPKLGAALATTAIIVGQVSTACLIDHLGLFGLKQIDFTWTKAVGIILLAAGARFMLH